MVMHNSRPARAEYKLLGGSFQLPDRRMQMCCWRRSCRTRCGCTSLPAPLPKDHSSPSSCASPGDFNFTAMYPSLSDGLLGPNAHCYHNKYHSPLDLLCFFHMQTQENGFGTERGRGTVWSIVSIRWPGASNFQSASVFPSTQRR